MDHARPKSTRKDGFATAALIDLVRLLARQAARECAGQPKVDRPRPPRPRSTEAS